MNKPTYEELEDKIDHLEMVVEAKQEFLDEETAERKRLQFLVESYRAILLNMVKCPIHSFESCGCRKSAKAALGEK